MKKSFLFAALCAVAIGASAQKWTGTWATAMEYTGKGDMPKSGKHICPSDCSSVNQWH